MTNANYTDDPALLVNPLAYSESLIHSLKQATGDIGFNMNEKKKQTMGFQQKDTLSTLSGTSRQQYLIYWKWC